MAQATPQQHPPGPTRSAASHLFTDPDAYTVANGLLGSRVMGRMPGRFRARIAVLDLDQATIIVGRATNPVTMRGNIKAVHAFTLGTSSGAPRHLSGREVAFGQIFHHRPNEVFVGHSPTGHPWPFGTVAVTFETLQRLAPAYAGHDIVPSQQDSTLVTAAPAARDRLIALLHDASGLAELHPEIAESEAPGHSLTGATLDALMACLVQGRPEPDRAAIRRHNRIIARLEALLEERPEYPWGIAEICAAIGASERTLNLACREFHGSSPIKVVRDRRLDAVQAALHRADPQSTTVAAEAMRFGFWELGRFAAAYRERFGERPSDTLRRPAG